MGKNSDQLENHPRPQWEEKGSCSQQGTCHALEISLQITLGTPGPQFSSFSCRRHSALSQHCTWTPAGGTPALYSMFEGTHLEPPPTMTTPLGQEISMCMLLFLLYQSWVPGIMPCTQCSIFITLPLPRKILSLTLAKIVVLGSLSW